MGKSDGLEVGRQGRPFGGRGGGMGQVTIINSTLGKALSGASGAYKILSMGSPSPHAGPAL